MRAYKNCEFSAYVFDKDGLNYKKEQTEPMKVGTYVHKMLEFCHRKGNKVHDLSNLEQSFLFVRGENMRDAQIIAKAYNYLQQLQRYYNNSYDALLDMTVVEVEYKFKNNGYSGIVDLIVTDGKDYYIVDYKTSSSVLSLSQRVLYDEQLQLYSISTKYPITGVYFVGIKTKEVYTTGARTKTGKISTSKTNKVSYESFAELLDNEGIPYHKYKDYLGWLRVEGTNNVIAYNEFSENMLGNTMARLEEQAMRILNIDSIDDCKPNPSYKCVNCPVLNQCLDAQNGITPDFTSLNKPEDSGVKVMFDVNKVNEDLFG